MRPIRRRIPYRPPSAPSAGPAAPVAASSSPAGRPAVPVGTSRAGRRRRWRAAVLVGAVAAGAFGSAPAALADVTVTPAVAVRGDAAKLTFEVPSERAGAHTTKVEVRFPERTPIAEVFPLSVPDWAPRMAQRDLATPIQAIHGVVSGQVVASITWTRVVPPSAPDEVVRLPVSLGPLPEAERVAFTVVQTYSDGTVVRWDGAPGSPAPTLTLRPLPGADAAAAAAEPPTPAAPADRSWALLGAGLAVGAGLAAGGWFVARARRAAATGESRWRLREPERT